MESLIVRNSCFLDATESEEMASSVIHGVGVILSLAGFIVLTYFAVLSGDPWRVASASIYGSTLVFLYLMSTLYHAARSPRTKYAFHVLDHISIYLLIAGTYTPYTLVVLRGTLGWSVFAVIWALALTGSVLRVFVAGCYGPLASLVYMAMGWLIVIAIKPMMAVLPTAGIVWLLAGGLAYTLGSVFFLWNRLPYNHAVWHLFVLIGSACHFLSVFLYVLPKA